VEPVFIIILHHVAKSDYQHYHSSSQVFPASSAAKRAISANSALSKIRQRRIALKQATNANVAFS
jgi:hypothetical protein